MAEREASVERRGVSRNETNEIQSEEGEGVQFKGWIGCGVEDDIRLWLVRRRMEEGVGLECEAV